MKKAFKYFLYVISILWLGFFLLTGLTMILRVPEQMQKDQEFINTKLKPVVYSIEQFKIENKRIPTVEEFHEINRTPGTEYFRSIENLPEDVQDEITSSDWEHHFVVAIWRGEWNEYYISFSDKYITNNYGYSDAFTGALFSLLIGSLPLGILLFIRRRNRRRNASLTSS